MQATIIVLGTTLFQQLPMLSSSAAATAVILPLLMLFGMQQGIRWLGSSRQWFWGGSLGLRRTYRKIGPHLVGRCQSLSQSVDRR